MGVAGIAAGHQVFGRVVFRVPIQVVRDDGICRVVPGVPGQLLAAPMARVRPRAELVVQGKPGHCYDATRRCYRMPLRHTGPMFDALLFRSPIRFSKALA